jgi:hypothetical protein
VIVTPRCSAILTLSLVAGALGGCAEGNHYRVLLPRASELGQTEIKPAPTPASTPAVADPDLHWRLAAFETEARKGQAAFDAQFVKLKANLSAGRTAQPGSEAWLAAQQAASALEAARGPCMIARGALEVLVVEMADKGGDVGAARATQARVDALIAAQDQILQPFR